MTNTYHRQQVLVAAGLLTAAMLASHLLHLPIWLFWPLIVAGMVIGVEGAASWHADHAAFRFERSVARIKAAHEAAQYQQQQQSRRENVRRILIWWQSGHPTARRDTLAGVSGATEADWTDARQVATERGWATLVKAQAGNEVLRWRKGAASYQAVSEAV